MFQKGELIFKAGDGVCRVEDVVTLKSSMDSGKEYFLLIPVTDPGIRVYLPLEGSGKGVRPLISADAAGKLLYSAELIPPSVISVERNREQCYKEALRSSDPEKLLAMLKHMNERCKERKLQGKKTTSLDERYYLLFEKAFYPEMSIVLNKTEKELKEILGL